MAKSKVAPFSRTRCRYKITYFSLQNWRLGKLGEVVIHNICYKFRDNSVAKRLLTVQQQRHYAIFFTNFAINEKYNIQFIGKSELCCKLGINVTDFDCKQMKQQTNPGLWNSLPLNCRTASAVNTF